jgi:hypothetical protein
MYTPSKQAVKDAALKARARPHRYQLMQRLFPHGYLTDGDYWVIDDDARIAIKEGEETAFFLGYPGPPVPGVDEITLVMLANNFTLDKKLRSHIAKDLDRARRILRRHIKEFEKEKAQDKYSFQQRLAEEELWKLVYRVITGDAKTYSAGFFYRKLKETNAPLANFYWLRNGHRFLALLERWYRDQEIRREAMERDLKRCSSEKDREFTREYHEEKANPYRLFTITRATDGKKNILWGFTPLPRNRHRRFPGIETSGCGPSFEAPKRS